MKTIDAGAVREIENAWIPMPDGTRLAARLWLPPDAEEHPIPAILEFIPYRKRDFTAARDAANHRWFAAHGYAGVRVDMRGSGDSEGVLLDEYIEQEQEDGLAILKWIAAQPWCDGQVGMFGISWGGFNGLQVAARRPPELKAIISVASTDDRYADDVHYMGGCLLGDNLSWASTMFAYNSSPPDPALVGERWRELWEQRLEQSGLWVLHWLRHQTRDTYWKHGSICEDFAAVECPVFSVSGWADGYSNAVFRLLEGLKSPSLGLIGPWSHKYPHMGVPGPAIGFLQECLRWWDHWLKGRDTGIMDEPQLRVWMQDSAPPATRYAERAGRWAGEPAWPSPRLERRPFPLGSGHRLGEGVEAEPGTVLEIQSPLSVGQFAGKWCSYSATPDLPADQREEDGGSLFWQTPPLAEPLEVLGTPVAELTVESNRPVAMVAVRLSDIAPDGKATRVSYGLLNLTHRRSHEHPEPLEPGRRERVEVPLNAIGHAFAAGHRVRLSLSTSLWPLAWPPPEPVRLTLHTGASALHLPVRPPREADEEIVFEAPEAAPKPALTQLQPGEANWTLHRDLEHSRSTLEVIHDRGEWRLEEIDLIFANRAEERYSTCADDFSSARGETVWTRHWQRGDWKPSLIARTEMTCTPDSFRIHAALDACLAGRRIFAKTWNEVIPRHLV